MECLLKLCAVSVLVVVRDSAAVGPLQSYLLHYKRSVLSNPNAAGLDGLASFNGFGGTPFNGFGGGGAGTPFGFGGYGQGFVPAYNSPGLQPLPAASAYGFGGAVPANFLQQYAGAPLSLQYGYGFDATGYHPFAGAAQYKFAQPPIAFSPQLGVQSLTGPGGQSVQHAVRYKTAQAPPKTVQGNAQTVSVASYSDEPRKPTAPASAAQSPSSGSDGGQQLLRLLASNADDAAERTRYPAQREPTGPTTFSTVASGPGAGAESAPTRFQIPSPYRPAVPETGATAAATPSQTPNLFLELTPPVYSEPYDYSKSPSPSAYTDFPSGSGSNQQVSADKYAAVTGDSNSPAGGGGGSYREPYQPSAPGTASNSAASNSPGDAGRDSYLVPSVSYSLPGRAYTGLGTEPNAMAAGYRGPSAGAENPADSVANGNFASNHLYGDPSGPAAANGPVAPGATGSSSFTNAYYKVPVDIPASGAYQSNPTSANTYGESNSIQSSSYNTAVHNPYGNAKLQVLAGNVYGDSNSVSSDKRESSDFAKLNYYPSANVYANKNVETRT